MTICTATSVVGENSFVVNGGGYNNEKITLIIPAIDDMYSYYTYGERNVYTDSSGNILSGLYLDASGQYMGDGSYAYFGFNLQNYTTLVGVGTHPLVDNYNYYDIILLLLLKQKKGENEKNIRSYNIVSS